MTFLGNGVKLLSTRKARVANEEDTETLSDGGEGPDIAVAPVGGAADLGVVRDARAASDAILSVAEAVFRERGGGVGNPVMAG